MVINTNISAQSTAALLSQSSSMLSQSLARLSSGSKITSPADDSAGLAVSVELTAEMGRINAASNNVADANSFNQTQDGYLQQVSSALNRMSELAIQSQDVTKSDSDRSLYDQEFQTLASFIKDVATKDFNGVSLFDGQGLTVTTDANGNTFAMTGVDILGSTSYTNVVGVDSATKGDSIETVDNSKTALTAVKVAISQLAADRANIGANEERLTMYTNTLATLNNNLSAANSQIMDVDVAQESAQYAKYNILV
jgi:flagellin